MDILWIILGSILLLAGLAGCFLPVIPGPPLAYLALLLLQLLEIPPFTINFLIVWALIVLAIMLLDYYIPIYGTKRFGGTKYGTWGCMLGLLAGMWLGPIGIIVGPMLGAFIGELVNGANSTLAFRAALGSFIGFLAGTLLKVICCVVIGYYFVASLL